MLAYDIILQWLFYLGNKFKSIFFHQCDFFFFVKACNTTSILFVMAIKKEGSELSPDVGYSLEQRFFFF